MKTLFNPWLFFSGMLILTGFTAWASKSGGGHLVDSTCQECHLSAKVEPDKARLLVASQEKLCGGCHPKAIQMSHPSGFIPKRSLSENYPLDWKGELTCSSCHQIHGSQPGLPRSSDKGVELCHACHDEAFFTKLPELGKDKSRLVHLNVPPAASTALVLEELSRQCMECHSDKGGSAQLRVGLNSKGIMRHMENSLSHPIGKVYALAPLSGYRPVDALPKNIVLQDGKVGCVSCHEKYNKKQHGGVIVTDHDSICNACHVQ
ncbi:MAG: cytochrome c3 family protein [Magnetococcales bacterium]|nr:cytochrome c3 family protein [Magnetococcales bacterium]